MIYLTKKEHQAIKSIYQYLVIDEKKHFEESGNPKEHIFRSLLAIKRLANLEIKE